MSSPARAAMSVADAVGHFLSAVAGAVTGRLRRARRAFWAWLTGEGTSSQFARFCIVGGISSVAYAVLFVSLSGIGNQVANTAGSITSTLLANELHRRLTFQAGGRVSFLTAQLEGGGLAVVGLVATSLSLASLGEIVGDTSPVRQLLLIAAVTGAIGLVRFVALRAWVFPAPSDDDELVELDGDETDADAPHLQRT